MTQEEVEREVEDRVMREELERRNMKVLMEMRQEEEEREREKAERKAAKRKQRLLQQQRLQKQSVNGDRSWVESKWFIVIGIVIIAVAASIYFDNGEEITW
jgi:Flp pilus assembly protein TadB